MTPVIVSLTIAPLPEGLPRREAERAAAARVVGSLLGSDVVIGHDSSGAPRLEGEGAEGLFISVSHNATHIAVVLSRYPGIGVDMENRSERLGRVIGRVSSAAEAGIDPLILWTVKEAVFKAAGISGLTIGEITVDAAGFAIARGRRFVWHMAELNDRRAVAVALREL